MSQVFRHYRQVKVVDRSDFPQPQVQGMEEIYCNGEHKVRYWGDPQLSSPLDMDEPLFDLMDSAWREFPLFPVEASVDGINLEFPRRHLRYLNPNEVVIESQTTKRLIAGDWLQKIRQAWTKGTRKARKMIANLPSALQSAWRELNR